MSSSIVFSGSQDEADFVRSFLQGHGIKAWLENETLGRIAPYLVSAGGVQPVKVVIPSEDVAVATELLKEAEDKEPGDDWKCPECEESIEGSFSNCWQCGAARTD